jgi:N-acetylmuramoyl-L-alanine amidase
MSANVIFPSAGHHLSDPGAVYNGRKESHEMMIFRDLVIAVLKKKKHKYVSDNDAETASQYQLRMKPGDGSVVCEFHLNAAANLKATGTEAVVKKNAPANSIAMAKELTDVTAKILGIKNRGVIDETKTARGKIGIVNKPGTAVLVEVCFLSNVKDMEAFDKHKSILAEAYADILIKYDNLI